MHLLSFIFLFVLGALNVIKTIRLIIFYTDFVNKSSDLSAFCKKILFFRCDKYEKKQKRESIASFEVKHISDLRQKLLVLCKLGVGVKEVSCVVYGKLE